jgi:hypothetical protein
MLPCIFFFSKLLEGATSEVSSEACVARQDWRTLSAMIGEFGQ